MKRLLAIALLIGAIHSAHGQANAVWWLTPYTYQFNATVTNEVSAKLYLGVTDFDSASLTNFANITVTNTARLKANARIGGTETDASNYEWLALSHDGAGTATIAAESAGAGLANQNMRILTKGTGAFVVDNSDATAGNARGNYAVDLQLERSSADQVASGINSVVIGGGRNVASGSYSLASGYNSTASGVASVAMGIYAVSPLRGQMSSSSGIFLNVGDAQTSTITARRVTSGNTQTNLTLNGAALAAGTAVALPNHTTWAFRILVAARSTDAGAGDEESAAYEVTGLIERDANAAATRIVGTPTVTVIAEDDAAWDFTVSADTTNGALNLLATGNDETAVRWVATVTLTQVGG